MKTFVITFALLAVTSLCCAQPVLVESQVIDAVTKEPLVGASVYAESETGARIGTISNVEGAFSFQVPSCEEILYVRYLGYESKEFKAGNIPAQISLSPVAYDIKPALVLDKEEFLKKLFEKYRAIFGKRRQRDNFFYRQTTMQGSDYTEILEAIFNARSELNLDDCSLLKGRYAKLQSDSSVTFANFFYFSQVPFLCGNTHLREMALSPLSRKSFKYYDISIDLLFDERSNDIYVVHFIPKQSINRDVVKGDLYINPSSMKVLRFVAEVPIALQMNIDVMQSNEMPYARFIIDFDNDAVIPIIRSIAGSMDISFKSELKEFNVRILSLLVKMNENVIVGKEKDIGRGSNLLYELGKMNDDPEFWRSNQIIKRTPLEEDALKMFEEQNLVGTYTTPVQ